MARRKALRRTSRRRPKRRATKRRRRAYRGLGAGMRIYSGYGRAKKMPISLAGLLPPLVGGTGALGSTLLMRAFIPAVKKDDTGAVIVDKEGNVKLSPFFQYAGLFGAGVGVLASLVLGPFQGWGASLAGALTAVMAGATAQFTNMVVPKDMKQYRGLGKVVAFPHTRQGARQMGPVAGMGKARRFTAMSGTRGLGLVAVTPADGQPGRTPNFMPQSVIAAANMGAFGQGNTGMGF